MEIITKNDWQALILAWNKGQKPSIERMKKHISLVMGIPNEDNSLAIELMKLKLEDQISEIMAIRLKNNCREIPLLSKEDFSSLSIVLTNHFEQDADHVLDEEERQTIQSTYSSVIESVADALCNLDDNPYESWYKTAELSSKLSNDYGIPLFDLFSNQEIVDQITKNVFSREEYLAKFERGIEKILNPNFFKNVIINMVKNLPDVNWEEDREEIERDIDEEVMPQINADIENLRPIVKKYIDEETARIYGTV